MEKQAAQWVPKEQKPASASPTRVKAGQRKAQHQKTRLLLMVLRLEQENLLGHLG